MANPAKVLNFFDVFGTWDPSLLLVMASAVTFAGYRVVLKRRPCGSAPVSTCRRRGVRRRGTAPVRSA